jgi:hypothetical protein
MKSITALFFFLIISFSVYAQKSNFAVGINAGVGVPVGDFSNFYNTGFGGDAHFYYHLGNQAIFSFTAGYNTYGFNIDEFNKRVEEANLPWRFELETDFNIIPILLGVKWLIAQGKKSSLYVSLVGGIYHYEFKFKATAFPTVNPGILPREVDVSESGNETMLALGLGYLIKLGKHWYLDMNGSYNIITNAFTVNEPVNPEDPDAVYGVKGTLPYVSLLLGINYRF